MYADPSDAVAGSGCCDPQPVSAAVAAAFLCAAARACDDPDTAARLEGPLDAKYLVRRVGRYYLDLDREWRIGASAQAQTIPSETKSVASIVTFSNLLNFFISYIPFRLLFQRFHYTQNCI